jgi:hypothetical protein
LGGFQLEQREIVHRYYVLGASTLDKVMKVLLHLSSDSVLALKDRLIPLKGENNLYKLMNREDPLTSSQLHEKVNLAKLKEQLEAQGLPFAFKQNPDGTNLYFRVKDTELAKKALEHVITSIKKNSQMILRKPNAKTFEERLAQLPKQRYKGGIQPTQSKGKGMKV